MTTIPPSPFDAGARDFAGEEALDALLASHRAPGILLQRPYPPSAFPNVRSRLGGKPQLPATLDWPLGTHHGEETAMHFLAQIDCSELPRVDDAMPDKGMLFFFAVNAEEQIWDGDEPGTSVRVLYAEDVPADTPQTEPPPALQPILSAVASDRSSTFPWPQLAGEDGPRLHTEWPLLAHRLDTWPEWDMIPEGDADPDYDAYSRRVSALRLGAAAAAIAQVPGAQSAKPWERPAPMPWNFPVAWLRMQKDFPYAGIMMEDIARMLACRCACLEDSEALVRDALQWVQRGRQIGPDQACPADDALAFREWIVGLAGEHGEGSVTGNIMASAFTRGALSIVALAGGSTDVAQRVPRELYQAMESNHLPFEEDSRHCAAGYGSRSRAVIHQMLGHAVLLQNTGAMIEEDPVCLLQLANDDAIDLKLGDCGQATFWIRRSDLAQRRFDRVEGVVESL
jgi:uncharacterized protein YwqG